jgi:hypothetical protein
MLRENVDVNGQSDIDHSFIVDPACVQVQSFVDVKANAVAVNPVFVISVPVLVSAEKLYTLILLVLLK